VDLSTPVDVHLAEPLTAVGDPAESWLGYGLVVDVDADGIADHRVGMDNAGAGGGRRGWGTDLHTGLTTVGQLDWSTAVGGFSGWGLEGENLPDDTMSFRWYVRDPELRFYVWASVIQQGEPVVTDFAPDVGWIPLPSSMHPPILYQ
jgi:hypothetical protein